LALKRILVDPEFACYIYPVREFNLNNNKKRVDIVVVVFLDTAMTLGLLYSLL
jgi:hypothetical protein